MQRQAFKRKRGKQEDPNIACSTACKQKGEPNRVDFPENKQQQQQQQQLEEQQKQEQQQEGQLRPADLSSKQKLEQRGETTRRGTKACIARSAAYPSQPQGEPNQLPKKRWCRQQHFEQKAWKETSKKQRQLAAACEQQLQPMANNNSLGIGEQETADRSSRQTRQILVDTGAELLVAPRSFAAEIQLSPLEEDLELRTANGIAIQTFGIRTVQLLSQGCSFNMNFVIADVEQPLLGLSSLLREKLSLHLDSNLGHHLGNTAREKIQLEPRGQQIYLVACPTELGLTPCMICNLLDKSLSPEAKSLGQEVSYKEVLDEGLGREQLQRQQLERQQLRRQQLEEETFSNTNFERKASTTELSQLQRRTLTTELAELERTALHTELAQLECSSFTRKVVKRAAPSFELSTAQL